MLYEEIANKKTGENQIILKTVELIFILSHSILVEAVTPRSNVNFHHGKLKPKTKKRGGIYHRKQNTTRYPYNFQAINKHQRG